MRTAGKDSILQRIKGFVTMKRKIKLSPLTDKEKDFAESNYKLIYSYLSARHLDPEDWYGICALAYIKAIKLFDCGRGSFSTFAYLVMDSEVKHTCKSAGAQKRTKFYTTSLDVPVPRSENKETFSLLEIIPDEKDDVSAVDTKLIVDKAIKSLHAGDRYVLCAYMRGIPEKDIAEKLGNISRTAVSHRLQKARKKVRDQLSRGA
jgi:RNA polymerase sigma factor (sigma-70 family)